MVGSSGHVANGTCERERPLVGLDKIGRDVQERQVGRTRSHSDCRWRPPRCHVLPLGRQVLRKSRRSGRVCPSNRNGTKEPPLACKKRHISRSRRSPVVQSHLSQLYSWIRGPN